MSSQQGSWWQNQWPRVISGAVVVVGLGLLGLLFVREPQAAPVVIPQEQLSLVPVADIPVLRPEYIASASATASSSAQVALDLETDFTATLSARALYALDVTSATPLLTKNPLASEYPASTTKLMTALVARQAYDLDLPLTLTAQDTSFGTLVGLRAGEVLTVKDLLAAVIIQSGNDAAVTLANHYPGGRPAFVVAMNQLAQALHLNQTVFTNADGLDMTDQKTTARDLSIVARQAALDPILAELAQTKTLTITDQSGIVHNLHNTNSLLGVEPGVIGLKTGTTEQAGEVLVTLVERDNRRILIVLMGSQNRYDETRAIIKWIFEHYHWLTLEQAQQIINQ